MWSQKHKNCQNCESDNNKYKAKGYCIKCYPLILKIEKTEKWDINKPESLKGFPYKSHECNENKFQIIKNGVIHQLKKRLERLKWIEKRLEKDVRGIHLEYGFRRIANYCGVTNKKLFYGSANIFDHNFSQEQKKIIFKFINDIDKNKRWGGIDWYKVLSHKKD